MHTKIKLIIEFVEMQREKICRLCLVTAATAWPAAAVSVAMDFFMCQSAFLKGSVEKTIVAEKDFFFAMQWSECI